MFSYSRLWCARMTRTGCTHFDTFVYGVLLQLLHDETPCSRIDDVRSGSKYNTRWSTSGKIEATVFVDERSSFLACC